MGLRSETAAIVAFIIMLVMSIGLMVYTIYVNQQAAVSFGRDAGASKAISFSGQYNKATTVGLDNGIDAHVNWDGKAVAVGGVGGEYAQVKNLKYYVSTSWGSGVKAENGCPFYAFLTGATRYDVKIVNVYAYETYSSTSKDVTIDYSSEVFSSLIAHGFPAQKTTVNGRLVIVFPVHLEKWHMYLKAQFYYGHSGVFGGCPSLRPDHGGYVEGDGTILVAGP